MDKSKRAQRMISTLDEIYSRLEYYMNGHTGLEVGYTELKKYIEKFALEEKEHNIRLVKKLKWFKSDDS